VDEFTKVLLTIEATLLDLQEQIDESAVNEIALIATLRELLPGFAQKFDLAHAVAKNEFVAHEAEQLHRLRQEISKLKPN
jgi:hypothetical protein